MDNSKVNGLNVPPRAQTTIAQPSSANPRAVDRFSRAMGDDRGMAHGTPISKLPREGSQENREYAYRRLSGVISDGAMEGLGKDLAADSATPRTAAGAELAQMIERMCSALYIGEQSVGTQRVVMALDHVLPGAAAEIVREGVHLSIRLHARSDEAFRSMSLQRDSLLRALSGNGERRVEVSVVQGNSQGNEQGLGHG